jgi:hypothetical protein
MKPGYKTTEFWLSTVAALVGIVMASGLVADDSAVTQILGAVMAVLSGMGYTAARGVVKTHEVDADLAARLRDRVRFTKGSEGCSNN